jgi:hypothetical protein
MDQHEYGQRPLRDTGSVCAIRALGAFLLFLLASTAASAQSLTLLTLEPGVLGQSTPHTGFNPYPMTGYGTYTGTAPTSATGTWTGCGGGAATVIGFGLNPYPVATTGASNSGASGTYAVAVNVPGTAGTGCTLTITTNLSTSATSPPTTVYAYPSGAAVVSNIHNAPGWLHSHTYTPASGPKTRVNNGAGWTEATGTWNPGSALNAYELTSGGSCTSAASGGPSGTGSSISDGTCTWKYLSATDYVSYTGWTYDGLTWVSGTTYTFGVYVATNVGGHLRSYWIQSSDGSSGNAMAFCTSTVAPSGTTGLFTTADGCTWNYVADITYSSMASYIPSITSSPNVYTPNPLDPNHQIVTSHLSRPYTALLWNDREYVAGSNGEVANNLDLDNHQAGHHLGGEQNVSWKCVGPSDMQDCPIITIKPAPGEGFASTMTPTTPLTGYDPTKGVAIRGSHFGMYVGDWNVHIDGLQIKSTSSDGLRVNNVETVTNSIIDGGYPGSATQSAMWGDVPVIAANNLIISHGLTGLSFKFGSSVALFNTIVNLGSVTDSTCITYQWAWVDPGLIAANNACYNFTHAGATATAAVFGWTPFWDARSKNNITTTASPDTATPINVIPGYSGDTLAGTALPFPNSTYNVSGATMFVNPGTDWRPGPSLLGAGASFGTFTWGCANGVYGAGCNPISRNFDTPDIIGTARPQAGSWTAGVAESVVLVPAAPGAGRGLR